MIFRTPSPSLLEEVLTHLKSVLSTMDTVNFLNAVEAATEFLRGKKTHNSESLNINYKSQVGFGSHNSCN